MSLILQSNSDLIWLVKRRKKKKVCKQQVVYFNLLGDFREGGTGELLNVTDILIEKVVIFS